MTADALPLERLLGPPLDAARHYGRSLRRLLHADAYDAYMSRMCDANRLTIDEIERRAEHWPAIIPDPYAAQITAMAEGAGVPPRKLLGFLYADVAGTPLPMCSAFTLADEGRCWVARNCDWLTGQLLRGVGFMAHAVPGRIPVLAMGILGDLDADTGLNAAGLWLHVHTMAVNDPPAPDRPLTDWLFLNRELLETCETLDEVESALERVSRNRGMIVVGVEGRTGRSAVFECTRSTVRRIDAEPGACLVATNHRQDQRPRDESLAHLRPLGSYRRRARAEALLAEHRAPGPDAMGRILGDPGVEMPAADSAISTIYAAVADPARGRAYLAPGPAPASRRRWVPAPSIRDLVV